jgi:hypothetical protein
MPQSPAPSIVFIIPYRDRPEQKFVFEKYMKYILEDYKKSEYAIYFVEQKDQRNFNRGALKNIGFLAMKKKYPKSYKKMTFVFNDIDTFPYKKGILRYKTFTGVIKHFFGFEHTLGGIFSITGADFEKIGGFPNFWTWGYEDNVIYNKASKNFDIRIDRSVFFKVFDHNIVHMTDSLKRTLNLNQINDKDPIMEQHNTVSSISNLNYSINERMIIVKDFDVILPYEEKITEKEINLTDHPDSIKRMKRRFNNVANGRGMAMNINTGNYMGMNSFRNENNQNQNQNQNHMGAMGGFQNVMSGMGGFQNQIQNQNSMGGFHNNNSVSYGMNFF